MNRDPDSYQWCYPNSATARDSHAAREPYDCEPHKPRAVRALCGARFAGYVEPHGAMPNLRCNRCLAIIKGVLKAP